MMLSLALIALGLGTALSLATATGLPDVLYRDVVVIGGGASGAYAAVRLRDDFHKSIALIEKRDILVDLNHLIPQTPHLAITFEPERYWQQVLTKTRYAGWYGQHLC